jgi:hypothetical protein
MDLRAEVVAVRDITPYDRSVMYALMCRYYAGMRRDVFEQDLDNKDCVIQIRDQASELLGFSTQVVWNVATSGGPARVLFSGDTIVDHRCWGQNPLAQAWGRMVLELIDGTDLPLFWLLIVKGYKTYRFLPLFFREFYPRYDSATPAWARELIGLLGATRFPDGFDPETGIVRAASGGCRLREGVADVTAERLRDAHVRHFVQLNPRHARGDELCCIAPLTRANFSVAAERVIGRRAFTSPVSA